MDTVAVKRALESIDGVAEAVVSHEKGTAIVRLDKAVDAGLMREKVEAEDYTVLSVA